MPDTYLLKLNEILHNSELNEFGKIKKIYALNQMYNDLFEDYKLAEKIEYKNNKIKCLETKILELCNEFNDEKINYLVKIEKYDFTHDFSDINNMDEHILNGNIKIIVNDIVMSFSYNYGYNRKTDYGYNHNCIIIINKKILEYEQYGELFSNREKFIEIIKKDFTKDNIRIIHIVLDIILHEIQKNNDNW